MSPRLALLALLLAGCPAPAPAPEPVLPDADGDGHAPPRDCDDNHPARFPGAEEACNGVDDDCDGHVDEDEALDAATWFADADGDGHGDPTRAYAACLPAPAWVAAGDDCDDADPLVHPGAAERCDGLDQDCDGLPDEPDPVDALPHGIDADGDGAWDPTAGGQLACFGAAGLVALPALEDCDDADPASHPGGLEVCGDGVDQDCDGEDLACEPPELGDLRLWSADLKLLGPEPGWQAGAALAAGDVDGDGVVDLLVGSPGAGAEGEGEVRLVLGPLLSGADLASPEAVFVGTSPEEGLGTSLVVLPDPGTGAGRAVLGAPGWRLGETALGAAVVFDGPVSGSSTSELAQADAVLVYDAELPGGAGATLSGLSDLDGDGWPELALVAPEWGGDSPPQGAVALFGGPWSGLTTAASATAVATGLPGVTVSDACAAELTGDGIDDLAVAAPRSQWDQPPLVQVYAGPVAGALLPEDAVVAISTSEGSLAQAFGGRLACPGDLTGDGQPDLLVGDPQAGGGVDAWLFAGPLPGDLDETGAAAVVDDVQISLWAAPIAAGDLDGDGLGELALGLLDAADWGSLGMASLFEAPLSGPVALEDAEATWVGEDVSDRAGTSVAVADLDGDGFDDLLVGAPGDDQAGTNAGAVYLILGAP